MSIRVNENFKNSTPFLRGYKLMRIPIIDAAGNSAWPEMFPMARIDFIRDTVGPRHFAAQMMLDFIPATRVRLEPGALVMYDAELDIGTGRMGEFEPTGIAIYWDPSSGRRNADHSVCVVVMRDDVRRRVFIHDIHYMTVDDDDAHPLTHQCEEVLNLMLRYGVRRIAIETNGIGNALPEILTDIAGRRGIRPVIEKVINHKAKEIRILDAIEPVLAAGRMYAHVRVAATPFLAEMLGWVPAGGVGHDDGLDAVAGAMCATVTPLRTGRDVRPVVAKTQFNI